MNVWFKRIFIEDYKTLPDDVRPEIKELCAKKFVEVKSLSDLKQYSPKKLRGFKDYYRLKVGDYRIGFKKENDKIIFMRVLRRRDIYKYFP